MAEKMAFWRNIDMVQIIEKDLDVDAKVRIYDEYAQIQAKDGATQSDIKKYSLMAIIDENNVGYISGTREYNWVMLSNMWVHENYRRSGIGSMLIASFEEKVWADGAKHIWLWTFGNINPLFYEKNGYSKFAVFEDYFGVEGYDQIGYRKDLIDIRDSNSTYQ